MIGALARLRRRFGARRAGLFCGTVIVAWFAFTRLTGYAAMSWGDVHLIESRRIWWEYSPLDPNAPPPWLQPLMRWDACHYVNLARHGYPAVAETARELAAFFPLYPILIAGAAQVVGDPFTAAVLLSHLFALLAAFLLARLASREGRPADGVRVALLFLATPGAHFLSIAYTEALFCLLVAGALLMVAHGRPLVAGLAGALASASRPPGVVVAVALLAKAVSERRNPRRALACAAGAALSVTGIAAYALFCWQRFGDPLFFVHVQQGWGRQMTLLGPLLAFARLGFDPDYYLVAIAAVIGAAYMIRRSSPPMTLSAWFLVLLPLSTGTLKSMVRFQSSNLPLLVGAGRALRGRLFSVVLWACLALMVYEAVRLGMGYANN